MNRKELKEKVIELTEKEDFKKYLLENVDELIDSSSLAIEKEEKESYGLAKVVLYCSLKRLADQYRPLSDYYNKEYKSLIKNY